MSGCFCVLNTMSLVAVTLLSGGSLPCTPLGWHLIMFMFVLTRCGTSFCQIKSVQRSPVNTYVTLTRWMRSCWSHVASAGQATGGADVLGGADGRGGKGGGGRQGTGAGRGRRRDRDSSRSWSSETRSRSHPSNLASEVLSSMYLSEELSAISEHEVVDYEVPRPCPHPYA